MIPPRPHLWLRVAAWFGVLLWAGTIHWFSSRTGPEIEEMNVFELSDKIAHFVAFFAGAVPVVCALKWTLAWPPRRVLIVAMLGVALYGAADEFHQLSTPNRSGADPLDWAADAFGGAAGALTTFWILYARSHSRQGPSRATPAGN